jgi:hypothetical protein
MWHHVYHLRVLTASGAMGWLYHRFGRPWTLDFLNHSDDGTCGERLHKFDEAAVAYTIEQQPGKEVDRLIAQAPAHITKGPRCACGDKHTFRN